MTLEHLLSGVAAVEEESKHRTSTSSDNENDTSDRASMENSSRDENSPRVQKTRTFEQDLPHAKYLRTEDGAVAVRPLYSDLSATPRELKPIQPMPKLPPISTLTQANGMPPSLQVQPVSMAMPGPRQSVPPVASQDDSLCRYRNKLCLNGRAVKRNGELHNLCEKHRAKANQNQRKLESKRRVQKRQTRHTPSAPPRTYQLTTIGAAVMPADAMSSMHHVGRTQHSGGAPLPSLAQLHRHAPPPPPPPSSSYPYYDGHYPPHSR